MGGSADADGFDNERSPPAPPPAGMDPRGDPLPPPPLAGRREMVGGGATSGGGGGSGQSLCSACKSSMKPSNSP